MFFSLHYASIERVCWSPHITVRYTFIRSVSYPPYIRTRNIPQHPMKTWRSRITINLQIAQPFIDVHHKYNHNTIEKVLSSRLTWSRRSTQNSNNFPTLYLICDISLGAMTGAISRQIFVRDSAFFVGMKTPKICELFQKVRFIGEA